ncbi:MAG: mechanosensitive ion channel family protein [Thermoplasmata archaeon]
MRARNLVVFGVIVLLAVLLNCNAVLADQVGSSEVLVFRADSSSQTVDLGDSAIYRWIFFNNGTSPYYVNATVDGLPEGFSVSLLPGRFILDPRNDTLVEMSFATPTEAEEEGLILTMTVEVTEIETGETQSESFDTSIELTGRTPRGSPVGKIFGLYDNFLPEPLNNRWGAFLFSLLAWIVVGFLLIGIVVPIGRKRAKRTESLIDDTIVALIRGPIFAIIVLFGAFTSLSILGLGEDLVSSLATVYGIVMILLVTWIAYQIFRRVLIRYGKTLARKTESTLDDRLVPVVDKIGAVVIVVFGVVFIMQYLGYDITLFLAGIGVLGLVIAFAAQDTLSNFFSGIHLMLDRPFAVGDRIVIESGETCTVMDVGLRSTKLYDLAEHNVIVLPNNKIAKMKVLNQTRPDERGRVSVEVDVAYGTSIQQVEEILFDIISSHPHVLKDEDTMPFVRFLGFGESSLKFMAKGWVDKLENKWGTEADLRKEIERRFATEGIRIPFPQRVVWLEKGKDSGIERSS